MSYRSNPYIVGSPVEDKDFYGRSGLLAKIWADSSRVIHLLGMRRIGKTSILKKLATMGQALYFNLQRTGGDWHEFNATLQRAIWRVRKRFPWLTNIEALRNSKDVFELLEIFDDAAREAGAPVWLLLDEAELLIGLGRKNIPALQKLRSVIWEMEATQVVFSSAKQLTELDELTSDVPHGSPFLNHFPPPVYIGRLEDEAAVALARQSQNHTPLSVPDELVQIICLRTNNHPYFIQWLCHHFWEKSPNAAAWHIDELNFSITLDLHRILRYDFEYLSNPERQVMRAVLLKRPLPDIHPAYVQGLVKLGYLRAVGADYEIGNDFFKNWLLDLENKAWDTPSKTSAEPTLRLYEKKDKQIRKNND